MGVVNLEQIQSAFSELEAIVDRFVELEDFDNDEIDRFGELEDFDDDPIEWEIEIDGFPEIDLIDRFPSITEYCRDCECCEGMDW